LIGREHEVAELTTLLRRCRKRGAVHGRSRSVARKTRHGIVANGPC
jgi:hypothetical protein